MINSSLCYRCRHTQTHTHTRTHTHTNTLWRHRMNMMCDTEESRQRIFIFSWNTQLRFLYKPLVKRKKPSPHHKHTDKHIRNTYCPLDCALWLKPNVEVLTASMQRTKNSGWQLWHDWSDKLTSRISAPYLSQKEQSFWILLAFGIFNSVKGTCFWQKDLSGRP